jgi:hypothetical protein
VGDLLLGHRAEEPGRIEAVEQHLAGALHDEGQGHDPGAVGQGRGDEADVLRFEALEIGQPADGHERQAAVTEHGALGPSGGARRVRQPGDVVVAGAGVGGLFAGVALPQVGEERRAGGSGPRGGGAGQHERLHGELVGQRHGHVGELLTDDEHLGPAIGDLVLHLVRGEPGVEGRDRRTRLPDGEQRLEELGAVRHHHRHAVARLDLQVLHQADGERRGPVIDFAVRPPLRAVMPDERRAVRIGAGRRRQDLTQVHRTRR